MKNPFEISFSCCKDLSIFGCPLGAKGLRSTVSIPIQPMNLSTESTTEYVSTSLRHFPASNVFVWRFVFYVLYWSFKLQAIAFQSTYLVIFVLLYSKTLEL